MSFIDLCKDLAEVWKIQADKKREQREKYRIEYAFTSRGTKYYQFADISNMPWQRARAALSVYNEIDMRCSRETLLKFTAAIDAVLGKNPIDIYNIKALNNALKDRLMLTADMDLCYRLAAVVFFDKSEKPNIYEHDYALKKIERWKKDSSAKDFFLQRPLQELMPFLRNVGPDIDIYTQLNRELNALQEQIIQSAGSMSRSTSMTDGRP